MMSKTKKVILFSVNCTVPGGMERVMFEEANYFEKNGIKTYILTYNFNKKVLFNETYNPNIHVVAVAPPFKGRVIETLSRILALRRKVKEINPDIIVSYDSEGSMYLYLATLFTPFAYVTHIAQAVSRCYGGLRRNALIYRKALRDIAESVAGHKEFTPLTATKSSLIKRLAAELAALVEYAAVRKAKKIFLFSNQMKWEVSKLYGREAIVVKGAFSSQILYYKPKQDIRRRLRLDNRRIILSITRLEPQKRVDLIIEAFYQVRKKFDDVVLVIGGTGAEEDQLKNLVGELNIEDGVIFTGFIAEAELWDYYAGCEVFVCAEWADINLAAYGALALQKKVVWPSSIEVDGPLAGNKHIFAAELTVDDYTQAMQKAITTEVTEKTDLSTYTWERYSKEIMENLGIVTA